MNKDRKKSLNGARAIKKFVESLMRGILMLKENLLAVITLVAYIVFVVVMYIRKEYMWFNINQSLPFNFANNTLDTMFGVFVVVGTIILLYLFSHPFLNARFERGFRRVGMYNKAEEPPYVRSFHLNSKGRWDVEFDSTGIPVEDWREHEAEIETALDVYISDIRAGKNRHTVILECVPADGGLSDCIDWDASYISNDDFVLAIGKSVTGIEHMDLNITSHALIAGSTGSGKTVAMKSLLYQCIKKNADVYLVDFKGGANFPKKLREHVNFVTTEDEFNNTLDMILAELHFRKQQLAEMECENITEYNKNITKYMKRIVLFVDEVAECFDKTGLSKAEKEVVQELEHKVSIIARLGRAMGIHLVLGLQRPSADVLPGQIKAQMDMRMCGRCDDVLSMIVLDNTDASRKIGKRERGRFVTSDGKLIQGFYFKDSDLDFQGLGELL